MYRYKKIVSILLAVLVMAVATTLAALRHQEQNGSSSLTKKEATPIQEGVMTAKQKEHAKLFKHNGRKLDNLAAEQQGDITVSEASPYVISTPATSRSTSLSFLQSAVCNADVIVVGVMKNESPQLTENRSFIFTDYEVTVEEVLKDNPVAPIKANNDITITRDGGTLRLGGRTIRAIQEDFKPFNVGGRYVLFLRYLPVTDSYLAYANGSFQSNDDKVIALGNVADDALRKGRATTDVLTEIRVASASGCKPKQKE